MRSDPQRSPPCCAYLGRRAGSGGDELGLDPSTTMPV